VGGKSIKNQYSKKGNKNQGVLKCLAIANNNNLHIKMRIKQEAQAKISLHLKTKIYIRLQ